MYMFKCCNVVNIVDLCNVNNFKISKNNKRLYMINSNFPVYPYDQVCRLVDPKW